MKWAGKAMISLRPRGMRAPGSGMPAMRPAVLPGLQKCGANRSHSREMYKVAWVLVIQRSSEAENKTRQVSEEAKQRLIAAEADAKAMTIKSEALQRSQSLVAYEAVLKWDGKLPVYQMGGATPFINVTPQKD
jgi:hypothetical protein